MLKKLAAIGLTTSIAFAPIVLTPAAAMAQAGPPVLANPMREGVITGGEASEAESGGAAGEQEGGKLH
jgi:hypothetical protein